MRRSPIRIAVAGTGLGVGLGVVGALGSGPVPGAGAASNSQSAQSEYQAALKAVGTQGVHFESTALQNGVSLHVVGDTGSTSGAQQLTVKNGSTTEHMSAMVVGSTGYVKGNAAALHNIIGLPNAQASKYANKWLSFPTSNTTLTELVSGLLNSQVAEELQMKGPFSYGAATTVGGKQVHAVRGYVGTESGDKASTTLYVAASGAPLPLEEVTNPGTTGGKSAIHGTVTFTKWGEGTNETAPSHAVSLVKLLPPPSTSTTAPSGG